MSRDSIKRLLALAVLAVMLAGCAANAPARPDPLPKQKIVVAPDKVDPAARAKYALALLHLRRGRDQAAEVLLEEIAKDQPDLPGPYLNLALVRQRQSKHQEALDLLEKGIERHHGSAVAYNAKGVSLKNLGRFQEAETAYRQSLSIRPDYANAHLNLGMLYEVYLQDFDAALRHYRRYQDLQKIPDEKVKGWISDLERRR